MINKMSHQKNEVKMPKGKNIEAAGYMLNANKGYKPVVPQNGRQPATAQSKPSDPTPPKK